jgi:uncharacterized protein with HEPN domain
MPSERINFLRHIFDELNYLIDNTKNLDREKFFNDETLQRAFTRSIEIIGEATKKLPDELKSKYPGIEWKSIAGMRDKLIHDYFGIDYELVWDILMEKVPPLKEEVEAIIDREFK